MNARDPVFEVLPRDLSAYRAGNTGVEYVHRFESGRPGPHLMVNALTHGNEFCGMAAVCDPLDRGMRPRIGTLTLSFIVPKTFIRDFPGVIIYVGEKQGDLLKDIWICRAKRLDRNVRTACIGPRLQ